MQAAESAQKLDKARADELAQQLAQAEAAHHESAGKSAVSITNKQMQTLEQRLKVTPLMFSCHAQWLLVCQGDGPAMTQGGLPWDTPDMPVECKLRCRPSNVWCSSAGRCNLLVFDALDGMSSTVALLHSHIVRPVHGKGGQGVFWKGISSVGMG